MTKGELIKLLQESKIPDDDPVFIAECPGSVFSIDDVEDGMNCIIIHPKL